MKNEYYKELLIILPSTNSFRLAEDDIALITDDTDHKLLPVLIFFFNSPTGAGPVTADTLIGTDVRLHPNLSINSSNALML